MKRLLLQLFALCTLSLQAQTFVEIGDKYPLNADGAKYSINGFVAFESTTDDDLYAKTLIWAIDYICPKMQEGLTINHNSKDFKCQIELASMADSGLANHYHCNVTFRIAAGKVLFHLTDILVESSNPLFKKVTAFESLSPQKNQRHQQSMDDFVAVSSLVLNTLFDHITAYELEAITNWSNIKIKRIVEGMNRDECLLAQGKPQSITESGGEEQWMYNSSFYIFFKDDAVSTIIK